MEIKELEIFLHLSQNLHFKQTAEAFHTSPSTLSRVIQRLEEECGQVFFARDNRSVSLTAAGNRFIEFAQTVLEDWRDLKNDFDRQAKVLHGELAIYCTVTAAHLYLPELLEKFRAAHPAVEVKLETGDVSFAYRKVAQQQADVAFAVSAARITNKFRFQHLYSIPFKLIAPRRAAQFSEFIKPGKIQWQKLPFVMPESGPAALHVKRWFKKMRIKPKIYAHVSGHEAIVSMTALGCGISAVPLPVLENSPLKDKVKILPVPFPPEAFDLGIISLKNKIESPVVEAFWDIAMRLENSA